jgi:gliding motility-associated-like protein
LYFAVYDRWGELMFETTDINVGWDGTYKKIKSDPAVFAWYLRAKCYNGEEIKRKGNVTLIR